VSGCFGIGQQGWNNFQTTGKEKEGWNGVRGWIKAIANNSMNRHKIIIYHKYSNLSKN